MAIDMDKQLKVNKLLSIPFRTDALLNQILDNLDPTGTEEHQAKATEIDSILAQYANIEYKEQTIHTTEFYKKVSKVQAKLKHDMFVVLGIEPDDSYNLLNIGR